MKNTKGKGRADVQPVTWWPWDSDSDSNSNTNMARARRASLRVSTAGGPSSYERHLNSDYAPSTESSTSTECSNCEMDVVRALPSLPPNVAEKIIGAHSAQVHVLDAAEAVLQLLMSGHTIQTYEGRFNMLHYAFALLTHDLYGTERAEWNRRKFVWYNIEVNSNDSEPNFPERPELRPHTRELVEFITCLLKLLHAFARDRLKEPQHLTHMDRRMRRMGDELHMDKISPLLVDIAYLPDSVTFMQAAFAQCLQSRSKTFMAELQKSLTHLLKTTRPYGRNRPLQFLPTGDPVAFETNNGSSNSSNNDPRFLEPHYHRVLGP